jgi:hypothetical protein
MIILLTPTMLATDVVTTARIKMARILKVPPAIIHARWFPCENEGMGVAFEVDSTSHELGITEEAVKAVIQTVWTLEYKRKLEWTLIDVKHARR